VTRALQIALPFDIPAEDVTSAAAPPRGIDIGSGFATESMNLAGVPASPAVAPTRLSSAPPHTRLEPFYFVRHRRARRYLLRVEPDGRLRVTIPRGGSKQEAAAFAARNLAWIRVQRARLAASALDPDDRARLRARALEELPVRLRELADEHGVTGLTRVTVRNQRTRWGSCGRDGHITLNWRLVLMPPDVRDYVLIHELMHLRRMDHSPAYWRHVAAACPSYAESRAWLRVNGRALR
jgi:predicted metal-dependent hydrolase